MMIPRDSRQTDLQNGCLGHSLLPRYKYHAAHLIRKRTQSTLLACARPNMLGARVCVLCVCVYIFTYYIYLYIYMLPVGCGYIYTHTLCMYHTSHTTHHTSHITHIIHIYILLNTTHDFTVPSALLLGLSTRLGHRRWEVDPRSGPPFCALPCPAQFSIALLAGWLLAFGVCANGPRL